MIARRSSRVRGTVLAAVFTAAVALVACQPAEQPPDEEGADGAAVEDAAGSTAETAADARVVELRATDYAFHAPGKFRSGWNTLRLSNDGEETHFVMLWRLPEGKTFGDYASEVVPAFTEPYERYTAGEIDQAQLLDQVLARVPDWLDLDEAGKGGVGLTAPGRVSQTSVNLEPGNYVMECYAVSDEGEFHGMLGMLRPLIVTDEPSNEASPEADVEMTLSNYEIATEGAPTPGEHTVRVRATEEPEGLLGHDVHLARLDEDTDLQEVAAWMSWVDGLRPPAPAEFVGGAEQVPAGQTTYFTVDLEPGRYAWISEGYAASQGMMKEFTVE